VTLHHHDNAADSTLTRLSRVKLIKMNGPYKPLQGTDVLPGGLGRSASEHSPQVDGASTWLSQQMHSAPVSELLVNTDKHPSWPGLLEKTPDGWFPTEQVLPLEPASSRITEHLSGKEEVVTNPLEAMPGKRAGLTWLNTPAMRVGVGLLFGIIMLVLVLYFVDVGAILHTLRQNVTTPRGMLFMLLASLSFISAFIFRALRWRLFLSPVKKVSPVKIIQLFLVGIFLNFMLPLRIGELAKCLILKRSDRIEISKSLPTITMDKVFDLLPALLVIAIVPLLGEKIDYKLWFILGLAISILIGMAIFITLTAWKRAFALTVLHRLTMLLPGKLGLKIEQFATNFVDSLLASAREPKRFLLAALFTFLSVSLDGLYNLFGFWTIGYPISFSHAVLGYMLFNLFYILPNPPGQVGSNEVVGLLIFTGLLHIPAEKVTAEMVFFHAWSALLMCAMGMASLSALGVTLSHAMKIRPEEE
jgi:uncharacterized protein (TIRG00374 family)